MTDLNLQPVHVYGMTETYGPITKAYYMPEWDAVPLKTKYQKMARQGHGFITSLPVRVIKTGLPDGSIIDVEQDGKEIGEVVFIGNICAKGYYKDPDATRKLLSGGVLHSGDLAVWHPDGAIQVPGILEAGVVAVPDAHWGERPKAFVTVLPGKHVDGKEVIEWAKHVSDISKFMVPKEVEVVSELPKTSTGKVKKNILREWVKGSDRHFD